jgi:beta-lactam-binding protein with PASTA domain
VRLNVATQTSTPATTPAITPTPSPPPPAATVTVPDVFGQTLSAARKAIRKAGLVTEVRHTNASQPRGTVVSQLPRPNQTARRGAHVLINISNGSTTSPSQPTTTATATSVPSVIGEDEATARADLTAARFKVVTVDQPTADPSQNGVVINQNPAAGTRVPAGSQVTIYVGRSSSG